MRIKFRLFWNRLCQHSLPLKFSTTFFFKYFLTIILSSRYYWDEVSIRAMIVKTQTVMMISVRRIFFYTQQLLRKSFQRIAQMLTHEALLLWLSSLFLVKIIVWLIFSLLKIEINFFSWFYPYNKVSRWLIEFLKTFRGPWWRLLNRHSQEKNTHIPIEDFGVSNS
jgi:hypothetical protein